MGSGDKIAALLHVSLMATVKLQHQIKTPGQEIFHPEIIIQISSVLGLNAIDFYRKRKRIDRVGVKDKRLEFFGNDNPVAVVVRAGASQINAILILRPFLEFSGGQF